MGDSDRDRDGAPIGPTEAALRLGVSTRTVQRWLKEGRLPSVQVGERLKVHPRAFDLTLRGALREPDTPAVAGAPIRRLLVANRGELVVRIARTCRAMGITPIALVPDDQAAAWWAAQVGERATLDGTYLDVPAVLGAARQANADAIHPGYGFLAENADFADAVEAAGLRWVGPPAAAMRAVGDKAAGRRLAASVGVPTVPGYDGDDQADNVLSTQALRIGFPVLVKPSAGGGGKGMHVARTEAELRDVLPSARREAQQAFGNDRLILERVVERPRHVEVQVLADRHGNAVHLGERDCSLQRRHQKVIEEAPSPAVDADLRARLGDAALRLIGAAGYTNAGTVEFLIDSNGGFYFLEVNARLQVEHPVTEAVTGRDLVADQLRIAAGEPLGFTQDQVTWTGHAVEARIYAEDPWNGFLPTVGTLAETRWPVGPGLRIDAGVGPGDTIGTRYDPLLAKIVSHANDREAALEALGAALRSTAVLGLTTNRGFLASLMAVAEVQSGNVTTNLIETAWQPAGEPSVEPVWPVAAAALAALGGPSAAASTAGFRLNTGPRVRVAIGSDERSVPLDRAATTRLPWAALGGLREPAVIIDLDGLAVRASIAVPPSVDVAVAHAQGLVTGSARVSAPMPGVVLQVRVALGDRVEQGQTLVVLEAMKMENAVAAPSPGTVSRLAVEPGQQVGRGDVLVELL